MWDILLKNLPLAVILIIAIIICGADLIKATGVWKVKKKERIDREIRIKQEKSEITEALKDLKDEVNKIHVKLESQEERFNKIEERLSDLTLSDMQTIKAWIVDQYHKFFVEEHWIDAFHADALERRYSIYKKEGGNSYIDTLMERIHSLPDSPPEEL